MGRKHYGAILVMAVVAGLVGIGVSSRHLMGQSVFAQKALQQAEVVRAETFELLDKNGKRRGVLGVNVNGEPAVEFFDQSGNLRAELSLRSDGGPNLLLWDGNGKIPRIGLAVLPDGNPSVELADKDGNLRTVFGLGSDGEPVLGLFDQAGNLHAAVSLDTTLGLEVYGEADPTALQ